MLDSGGSRGESRLRQSPPRGAPSQQIRPGPLLAPEPRHSHLRIAGPKGRVVLPVWAPEDPLTTAARRNRASAGVRVPIRVFARVPLAQRRALALAGYREGAT